MIQQLKNLNVATKELIEYWLVQNVDTFDVAKIVNVEDYSKDRTVNVLPLCTQRYTDGLLVDKSQVSKCPVILQGTKNGVIHFPPQVNDKVLIGYPKDSIEEFIYSSGDDTYNTIDDMKFQGRQACVLGYIARAGSDIELSSTDFELIYNGAKISISDSGVVTIESDGATFTMVGGAITMNGATATASGDIVTASGNSLDDLTLAYSLHGTGPGPSAPHHPPPPI